MAAALRRGDGRRRWCKVKQVTKANFAAQLDEVKARIQGCDFVAVSTQRTGAYSAPWRRPLPFDTPEIAYRKSKDAAERYELLQIAVCPFAVQGSKVVAHPYNFHLFPRDEFNLGMPSYSFLCQTSSLESMARRGFDFNGCIHHGISYMSRVQEAKAQIIVGNPDSNACPVKPSSTPAVGDTIFMQRVKSRVRHWRGSWKNANEETTDALVSSLRKIILGNEVYGSRPCITIDVCSSRQVQLVVEVINSSYNELIPLIVHDKAGEPKAVKIIFTSSEEDMKLLQKELMNMEEERSKQLRGFREIIDTISSAYKPVVTTNCLQDFTFIHSKFIAPLPPIMSEFMCSLRMVFYNIVDLNQLWKEVGPLKKANHIWAASSYLRRQFFVPLDLEIPLKDDENEVQDHGDNIVRVTHLFCKLIAILNVGREEHHLLPGFSSIENCTNNSCTSYSECESESEDEYVLSNNGKKVSTENILFLWGFRDGISARELKCKLCEAHSALFRDFDLQLLDKNCAVMVFWTRGSAKALLEAMDSGGDDVVCLANMISEGLKAATYETYRRLFDLDITDADLADCLDKVLQEPSGDLLDGSSKTRNEIYWNNDYFIRLEDL